MKIWFNKNFSSIAFILAQLQKNTQVTTLFSHTHEVEYQHYADHFIYEPEQTHDYLAFCLDVCKQYQIDVFYPWRGLAKLYPHRAEFAALGVKVIFSCTDENFAIVDNKASFYQHLISKQIAVNLPLFASANHKAEFIEHYQLLREKTEKLCMKPAVSIYAAGFKVIHDEADYDPWKALVHGKDKYCIGYQQLIDLLPDEFFKQMMILDFLPGDEYSHDILCQNGDIISGTIRQKFSHSDKYQLLVQQDEITRMSRLLVAEFELNGFINIQYRNDKNQVPFVLEINPRISGGISKIAAAGIDYVDLFVKMLSNQAISAADIQQDYDIKVT
jgi:hypothetical protein